MPLVKLNNFNLRNKLVAEAFYLTNNIEKYESGFIRIRKALQYYPEAAFAIQEMGGGVLLTFARTGASQKNREQYLKKVRRKIHSCLGNNMNNQPFDLNDIENEPSDEQLMLHEWTS